GRRRAHRRRRPRRRRRPGDRPGRNLGSTDAEPVHQVRHNGYQFADSGPGLHSHRNRRRRPSGPGQPGAATQMMRMRLGAAALVTMMVLSGVARADDSSPAKIVEAAVQKLEFGDYEGVVALLQPLVDSGAT